MQKKPTKQTNRQTDKVIARPKSRLEATHRPTLFLINQINHQSFVRSLEDSYYIIDDGMWGSYTLHSSLGSVFSRVLPRASYSVHITRACRVEL